MAPLDPLCRRDLFGAGWFVVERKLTADGASFPSTSLLESRPYWYWADGSLVLTGRPLKGLGGR